MRLATATDGRSHAGLASVGANDHHREPTSVEILNTSQVIAAGASYNLDIALPSALSQLAHVQIIGAMQMSGLWREGADVYATRTAAEAIGYSFRMAGTKQVYSATYSKQNGDLYLSCKVFDANLSPTQPQIALLDAVLTGSVLRLTFKNYWGSNATLWVKGRALVW